VGLVSGVFETREKTLEKALELARKIGEKSPIAVQATKEILNFSRDHSVQDGEFSCFDGDGCGSGRILGFLC
jgi:delta(3,5)-delta(2,4)-dienoyl-CoA isomerase